MLESGFTSVLGVRSRDELQSQVVAFTKRLGFETVSATVVIDHSLGEAEFITVDNTPRAYREAFQNRENWRRDPVAQHCKRQSMPIIWDQSTYAERGLGDMWEYQRVSGIAMASPWRCTCQKAAISFLPSIATSRSPRMPLN
jgi:alpha-D-ribose 1-methylphosphonate 5-triphosphate diphosphatase PhnM